MPQSYRITELPDRLIIRLSPIVSPIIAFGFFMSGLVFIVLGASYLFMLSLVSGLYLLIPIGIILIYVLVGINMLQKMTFYEIIELTSDDISITRKYSIGSSIDSYPVSTISNISFVGREEFTPHPFEGKHFDIGFGAMEKEVQYLISDGNILMSLSDGTARRFGRNVPSWDAEDIITQIENYTGRKFTPLLETTNIDEDEWMDAAS